MKFNLDKGKAIITYFHELIELQCKLDEYELNSLNCK